MPEMPLSRGSRSAVQASGSSTGSSLETHSGVGPRGWF